jgi:alpha-L-fucosidase
MDSAEYREQLRQQIDEVIAEGAFQDTWESLSEYRTPAWFSDSRFGIFIHWGLYSVPAFENEWYPRRMYMKGTKEYEHHIRTYGPHSRFGLKDFVPLFQAEKFDAVKWAELFVEAGARFVVPVAEHHDGFQMYKSSLSSWNAYDRGPHRDILGEEKKAFEDAGLIFCCSSHRVEHWFFLGAGREFQSDLYEMDQKEPLKIGDMYWPSIDLPDDQLNDLDSMPYPTDEFMEDWLFRCCELVDRYQPRLVYFDWWIQHQAVKPWLRKFMAYYYNRANEWKKGVVIAYKNDACAFGSAVFDMERGKLTSQVPFPWETDTAVARNSWGHTDSLIYKSPNEIICYLADVVSKNGTLLLNIGPGADGTIPEEDAAILKTIGAWLKVNGEAIYHSRCWRIAEEGPTREQAGQFTDAEETKYTAEDFRFTSGSGCLYAIALHYPEDGKVCIRTFRKAAPPEKGEFNGIIKDVSVLGSEEKINWTADAEGLKFETQTVGNNLPVVIRIRTD